MVNAKYVNAELKAEFLNNAHDLQDNIGHRPQYIHAVPIHLALECAYWHLSLPDKTCYNVGREYLQGQLNTAALEPQCGLNPANWNI